MCSSLSKQQGSHVQKAHSFIAEKLAFAPKKNIMNREIINIQMQNLSKRKESIL